MDKLNVQRTWPSIQGMKKNVGTDTIEFIFYRNKPKDRKSTCVRAVRNIRPQKTETRRTRLTAGINIIVYPGDVRTPTSELNPMKLHVNSTFSDVKSRHKCMYVKYFYLNNMMDRAKYIMI